MAAAVPTRSSSFFEWLAGRTASEATLSEYLASSGEWWNSEFKAASEDVDYSLRKAVCALANTRGGEVFVGVRDDRTISGTTRTGQQLGQVLKQSAAPPGEWYVVDLTRAVFRIVPVPVGVASPRRFVYVLEIVRVGLPVFVFEKPATLSLYLRHADSTELANSFHALAWSRDLTREEILRTCYLELKTLSRVVTEMFAGMAMGLGLNLPYMTKRLEDGTFYRYLTDEDITFILGRVRGSGYEGGIVRWVFETRQKLEIMRRQGMNRGEEYRETDDVLRSAREDIPRSAESFKRYLEDHGIAAD